jgi:hypothetical protein
VLWAAALALLVAGFASLTWGGLLLTNLAINPPIPWSFVVMAGALWLMWQYLGGRWRPRGASGRRALLRFRLAPRAVTGGRCWRAI